MNLDQLSKQELIQRIRQLETENQELRKDSEQMDQLQFSWTGNLGRWYWDIQTNSVTFNPLKVTTLGYDVTSMTEPITYQFFTEKLHPDDYEQSMQAMRDHLSGKHPVYECEYRIRTIAGEYKWYYDRGRITRYDAEGKPLFVAGIVFDITEQKRIESELKESNLRLEKLTLTDPLTQLHNVRSLYLALEKLKQKKTPFSLAMLDLDNFKQVNDQLGHLEGDQTLVEVANVMRQFSNEMDICGRYGGEEFLIIMPERPLKEAIIQAESIRKHIEKHFTNRRVRVTTSIGVVEFKRESIAAILQQVDEQLYQAKALGKNRVVGR
ncbi:MAG: diguanylate cyclase [Candidatus Izemoplasmatales bacterium]|nr:diguanylate cyclase [Candidatus Izemoplasmatales bacterium]NLF49493.1 diguanylate cyclase [Acholeplasmataceae bacterium]